MLEDRLREKMECLDGGLEKIDDFLIYRFGGWIDNVWMGDDYNRSIKISVYAK